MRAIGLALSEQSPLMLYFVSIVVSLVLGGGSLLTGDEPFKPSILQTNDIFSKLYFFGAASLLLSIVFALVALKLEYGLLFLM